MIRCEVRGENNRLVSVVYIARDAKFAMWRGQLYHVYWEGDSAEILTKDWSPEPVLIG